MKVRLVGAGVIGTVYGSHLAADGHWSPAVVAVLISRPHAGFAFLNSHERDLLRFPRDLLTAGRLRCGPGVPRCWSGAWGVPSMRLRSRDELSRAACKSLDAAAGPVLGDVLVDPAATPSSWERSAA
jgi:hypothetical protein